MSLPFFFTASLSQQDSLLTLSEETSKHIVQVLRMQEGEHLQLTDGKGNLMTCSIAEAHKKKMFCNQAVRFLYCGLSKRCHYSHFFDQKYKSI